MDWKSVASSFHVLPAGELLAMQRMERHQDVRDRLDWLSGDEPPVALLLSVASAGPSVGVGSV